MASPPARCTPARCVEPLAGAVMTPDLPDLHLRAGRAGPAQGLRVRADPEPHPRGARAQRGQPRGRHATASPSAPGWPRSTPCSSCFAAGDHVVCGENVYGGTHRLMERIYASLGLAFTFVDMRDVGQRRARPHPGHPDGLLRDAHQPDDEPGGPRRGRRPDPGPRLPLRGGQHLRHAVLPAAAGVRRRHRAPLHHQVPERPQRHGGRPAGDRRATTWPSGSASSRTPPARCPGRWTAGWRCAASRPCRSACGSTTPTAAGSPSGSPTGGTSQGLLPGPAVASAARARLPADERLRRDDLARAGRCRHAPAGSSRRTRIFALAESLGGVESLIGHPAS